MSRSLPPPPPLPHPSSPLPSRNPPTHYRDLSSTDILALTTYLSHPNHQTSSHPPQLPPHLLLPTSRLARALSSLCPAHCALNPLPLTTLLAALQHEVSHTIPRVWLPLLGKGFLVPVSAYGEMLEHVLGLAAIWDGSKSGRGSSIGFDRTGGNCAACCLREVAADFKALAALGVCLLARMSESGGGWKGRSKKAEWVMAALVAFGRDEEAKGKIKGMVQVLSGEMREARRKCRDQRRLGVADRGEAGAGSDGGDVGDVGDGCRHQQNQPFDRPRARHRARSVFTRSRSKSDYGDEF